jgi:predicted amidohydrolase YtcJ
MGIYAAVTRCRPDGTPKPGGWFPEQRLDIQEALAGYTLGPAYAAGTEHILGKLSAGFLADMIVVDSDPFACDPADLHNIQPVATMIGGNWAWKS